MQGAKASRPKVAVGELVPSGVRSREGDRSQIAQALVLAVGMGLGHVHRKQLPFRRVEERRAAKQGAVEREARFSSSRAVLSVRSLRVDFMSRRVKKVKRFLEGEGGRE